jgi:hypothetical protein
MRVCPINSSCIGFDSVEEFEKAFTEIAEKDGNELDDDMCVEGNSGLTFGNVKAWVEYCGLENIYFDNGFKHGFIDTFYLDLKNAKHTGMMDFSRVDEASLRDGFLRIWFD